MPIHNVLVLSVLLALMPIHNVLGAPQKPSALDKEIDQCIRAEWTKHAATAHDMWMCEATPTIPGDWPAHKGSILVVYGYVYKLPANSSDCVDEAGPYCSVLIDPAKSNEAKSNQLAFDVHKTETQGVRSVGGTEKDILGSYERVQDLLASISLGKTPSEQDLQSIKSYFRLWRSCNGVIAARIAKNHKEFFSWLDSK